MTKQEYNNEANKIRRDIPLTYPPDAAALALYARAFNDLNDRYTSLPITYTSQQIQANREKVKAYFSAKKGLQS